MDQVWACLVSYTAFAVPGVFPPVLKACVCLCAFKQTVSFLGKNHRPLSHRDLESLPKKVGVSVREGDSRSGAADRGAEHLPRKSCLCVFGRRCVFALMGTHQLAFDCEEDRLSLLRRSLTLVGLAPSLLLGLFLESFCFP